MKHKEELILVQKMKIANMTDEQYEAMLQYQREYRKNNKEKFAISRKKYYESHKEQAKEYGKKYWREIRKFAL